MEKSIKILSIVLIMILLISSIFIFFDNKKITYKNPSGIYCIANKGIYKFESKDVPKGAILIQSIPDYTNGEYTKRLNTNFFKMMGCID